MTNENRSEDIRKLKAMIEGIQVGMVTTIDSAGTIHSRPMAIEQMREDGDLWFFTRADSAKVGEVGREPRVSIAFADIMKDRYVSVSGMAEIVRDPAKARELWSPIYRAWFPKGLDDPELSLFKVRPTKAEYWDRKASRMVTLFSYLRAVVTGKHVEPGGNRKLDLAS